MGIQGKVIVFTGKISKPRHEFQALVETHGGITGADVSSKTDYLVVGEKPGSKLIRATSLNIQIITEGEFLKLLEEDKQEEEETPLSFAEMQELDKQMEERICVFCGRVYKQFKTVLQDDTCFLCETNYPPKCPKCSYRNPHFITDFKLYHCFNCWHWFKAPFSPNAHRISHLHIWYKKTEVEKGTKEECFCGAVLRTHKDGTWEKHEPNFIIERGRKEAHEFAVEEEQRCYREAKEKEQKAMDFLDSLTPSDRYLLEEQLRGSSK